MAGATPSENLSSDATKNRPVHILSILCIVLSTILITSVIYTESKTEQFIDRLWTLAGTPIGVRVLDRINHEEMTHITHGVRGMAVCYGASSLGSPRTAAEVLACPYIFVWPVNSTGQPLQYWATELSGGAPRADPSGCVSVTYDLARIPVAFEFVPATVLGSNLRPQERIASCICFYVFEYHTIYGMMPDDCAQLWCGLGLKPIGNRIKILESRYGKISLSRSADGRFVQASMGTNGDLHKQWAVIDFNSVVPDAGAAIRLVKAPICSVDMQFSALPAPLDESSLR